MSYPGRMSTCDAGVVRGDDYESCDKPAVALMKPTPEEIDEFSIISPWPVCVHHARVGRMVPLRDVPAELTRLGVDR